MMGIHFDVYGIGRIVYELPDDFCAHYFASKHFNCEVRGRLNNALKGGNVSGRRCLPYHG